MADDITFVTAKTKETPTVLREYSLNIDSYNSPLVYKNFNALGTLIMRLLLLEPGTITHSPNMGLGLISKYRYIQSDKARQLAQAIKDQIKDYIDNTIASDVNVSFPNKGENIMVIDIRLDQYQFRYFYDRDKITLKMLLNDEVK